MNCFKNKDGINIPVVVAIADFLRGKGYDIANEDGYYIEALTNGHIGDSIGVLIKDSTSPKTRFLGLNKKQCLRRFVGCFNVESLENVHFRVFGRNNMDWALKLSKELVEHVKDVMKDVKIEIFLYSERIEYENHYGPCWR